MLDGVDQDDEASVDMEKVEGVLKAVSFVNVSGRSGVINPGLVGAKRTTTTAGDDDDQAFAATEPTTTTTQFVVSTVCIPATGTASSSTTATWRRPSPRR